MAYGWDESRDAYNQTYSDNSGHKSGHDAKFGHELLAGGAAFVGMKLFEDHQRKQGKTVSHAFAKEALVGFVGAEVDRLIETKGRDAYDRKKTHHSAREHAERMYDDHYVRDQGAEEYDPNAYRPHEYVQGRY